jgi:hypothetical protein
VTFGNRSTCEDAHRHRGRRFPTENVEPFEIDISHADTFALDQLDLAPGLVVAAGNSERPRPSALVRGRRMRKCSEGFNSWQ